MNSRERILAVILGRELDRVPFVQYHNLGAPDEEVWSELGRDSMGILRWTSVHRLAAPNCRFVAEEVPSEGPRITRRTLHTPRGTLTEMRRHEPVFGTANIYEHFVKQPEHIPILTSYFRDLTVVEDLGQYRENRRELGEDGLSLVSTGRTPYQQLWVQWVSLTDLVLLLVDYPDMMAECIAEMQRIQSQVFEIVARSPAQLVDVPDNITAPAIGVRYFEQYCAPAYRELAEMLDEREQPVPVFVHMDGDLGPLRECIGESRVGGIDSFSPPPDNDNSPAEALALWPHMRLLVNFPSSVHLQTPQVIYQTAMQILQEAGHSGQLQIQISENVPPGVWRTSYPQIVRAIQDFGRPGGRA
jgi:hypothetical protein